MAEPVKSWESAIGFTGSNYIKHNTLYWHYNNEEYHNIRNQHYEYEKLYGGYYGPYWPAHFGGGYFKLLKRRSTEPAIYNDKNPYFNFIRRIFDEFGYWTEWPRGQDHHILYWAI
eukprot:UN10040